MLKRSCAAAFALGLLGFLVFGMPSACGAEVRVLLPAGGPRAKLLRDTDLLLTRVETVEQTLADGGAAIIDATPENLKRLAEMEEDLKSFTETGGWLMLWGLTPKGLESFNEVIGVRHMIRPFEMEEVEMPLRADPLLKGVRRSGFFMLTGKSSGGVVPVRMRVDDAWTYVVDYDDVAPFCTLPGHEYWGVGDGEAVPGQPHCPRSMVNGLTYHWRFAFLIRLDRDEPSEWTVELPRKEEVVQFSIMPSVLFYRINKLRLDFHDEKPPVELELEHLRERQDFKIEKRKTEKITISITDYREKEDSQATLGIVNFWIKVKRSEEFYEKVHPLVNIGVLVKYPMGEGGIILNQMSVLEEEPPAENEVKKRNIAAGLLENMAEAAESP